MGTSQCIGKSDSRRITITFTVPNWYMTSGEWGDHKRIGELIHASVLQEPRLFYHKFDDFAHRLRFVMYVLWRGACWR